MSRPPSPYQLQNAMTALLQARQQLAEIDPSYLDDERLVADHLEAEASDAIEVLHRMVRAAVDARCMAEAADARAKDLQARRDRFKRREDVCRAGVQAAMECLDLRRLNLPDLDATVAAPSQPAVIITDESQIPDSLMRIVKTPDKATIRGSLLAGEVVPGATLSNPRPALRIKAT